MQGTRSPSPTPGESPGAAHAGGVPAMLLLARLPSTPQGRWRALPLPAAKVPGARRMVEWEDGSMQLFVGSEVLDVKQQDVLASNLHLFVRHKEVSQARHRCSLVHPKHSVPEGWCVRSGSCNRPSGPLGWTAPHQLRVRESSAAWPPTQALELGGAEAALRPPPALPGLLRQPGMQGMGQVPARISVQPASLSAASHKRLRAAAEKRHAKAVLVRQAGALAALSSAPCRMQLWVQS